MADLEFITMAGGLLRPADEDVAEKVKKWGAGNLVMVNARRPRNYKLLQKFFVMLRVGFEAQEEVEREYKGKPIQKSKERFRSDVIISAGYWHPVVDIQGNIRPEADSISFGSMEEDEFGVLYNKCQEVLLKEVLENYTQADLDSVVDEMMRFL
jgi:hypothetical protein